MIAPAALLPRSLLWRTFLLITLLLLVSLIAWITVVDLSEREPRAQAAARWIVSIVNLTRAALITAAPDKRIPLLRDLSQREGIRVYSSSDHEEPLLDLPDSARNRIILREVQDDLGDDTQLKLEQEGVSSFLVSFRIDDEQYWLALPRGRIERPIRWEWIGWSALAAWLAMLGAWYIVSRINSPLRALTDAAAALAGGERPQPMAETGATELRTLAGAFNRMTAALQQAETERALLLAGVSHDLRTPLSRLRLAVEMSIDHDSAMKAGMVQDIEDMDAIIDQFLDFARDQSGEGIEPGGDLNAIVRSVVARYERRQQPVSARLSELPPIPLRPAAIQRLLVNLIENALRHSGTAVEVETRLEDGNVVVAVGDRGPGIAAGEAQRMLQPFTRMEASRSGATGSGLGLAIVQRIAALHRGRVELLPRPGGGLEARVTLPLPPG
ncbi:MAG: HAMP domain-containing protein [Betaproteobacteria bacterium]|nr:HAMP domain-containing protein [Betaproteobacteria bacterium]